MSDSFDFDPDLFTAGTIGLPGGAFLPQAREA
jgi:hypothetical protein